MHFSYLSSGKEYCEVSINWMVFLILISSYYCIKGYYQGWGYWHWPVSGIKGQKVSTVTDQWHGCNTSNYVYYCHQLVVLIIFTTHKSIVTNAKSHDSYHWICYSKYWSGCLLWCWWKCQTVIKNVNLSVLKNWMAQW